MVEALAQAGAVAVLSRGGEPRQARALRRHRRRALQAHRAAGRRADARVRARERARPDRPRQGARDRRRRARRARHADLRGRRRDDRQGERQPRIGDHRARLLRARPGADERRALRDGRHDATSGSWSARASASAGSPRPEQALSDLALPAARTALEQAGAEAADDRPDHRRHGHARHGVSRPPRRCSPTELGMPDAAAYDLSAGCTGFMYALAQAYGMLAAGLSRKRALVVGGDVLSKILDWTDRSTLVLFGDGAGAVVHRARRRRRRLPRLRARRRRRRRRQLYLPGSGSRRFERPGAVT